MRLVAAILALGIATTVVPVAAKDRGCRDDNGAERCAPEALRRQEKAYGVEAIDALGARGAQVIRAFFVDGYGRDVGLVSFVRGPASEPRVEWMQPLAGPADDPRVRLSSVVPLATWEDLQADGEVFDRPLAPEPASAELSICLHGWVVRVETVDAGGKSHASVESTCVSGLVARYGFRIAKAAVAALPSCALLDPERTRNDVTRLADCTLLTGDRAAAAQAYNVFRTPWFASPGGPDFARPLLYLFHDRAELSWPGQPAVTGWEAASRVWAEQAAKAHFLVARIYGETPDRVRIEGTILPEDSSDPRAVGIPATLIWTRENGFGFRLRSLTSGAPASS
ncbi:hypothetical protein [Novosphingobium soli]|uniref:Uncharacterized protein n=1 Tax=Novosphingobium soli TaxID=574956 RepID=A0ABV6CSU7_9SPHN